MTDVQIKKTGDGESDEPQLEVEETSELAPWRGLAGLSVVGRRHPRVEGEAKVTGAAQFTYDVHLPGQLHAAVLRSPHPHARILRIDTSKAEALPGVHAVLSSANTPEMPWYEDGHLFDQTVRFVGDEVAAVAADSMEIAEDALRLIAVDYEPLPFVIDLEAALRPDAPKLREEGNLAGEPQTEERGDIEAGFRDADVVVEGTYRTQTALHNCLEPHGSTASWEGDRLTLWDSTQSIFTVREDVAEKLDLPEGHVRVIKQYMGGGFGSKQIAWKNAVLAALLAQRTGRPVQLILDREAENLATGARNATVQTVRLGAKHDGTLTAIDAVIHQETGAYQAGGEASDTSGIYQSLYKCDNVRTAQTAVYTNTGPVVAFRAPGHVESAFALEGAMDELARSLEMDPVALRLKNYSERDQQEDKPLTSPAALRHCIARATETFGWGQERPTLDGPKRRGIGFAAHDWAGGGGSPPGYAWVKLNPDGTADVVTGTQDIGTGTRTALSQIAAEELGVPMDTVSLHLGDTANGPYSPASAGSATLATIGPATRAAAAEAKKLLLEAASRFIEVPADQLSVRAGKIYALGEPEERAVPVGDVTGAIAPHMLMGQGARGPNSDEKTARTFGAQCVEVEVDTETGQVTVLRVVASHDCGLIINPTMVDSQIIGGVTQGIGFALTEERVVDARSGVVLNADLEEYKIPTVADIPPITHAEVNIADYEANPTGAKGIGEPPLIPTAPAIANAVFDAVGIRVHELPITPQRLLALLADEGGKA